MEFCENFYKNLPNNIMTVLSDLTEKYTEKAPEKTCIVTTHRPGVLRLCRRVYRVENGKIAEMSDLGEKRK